MANRLDFYLGGLLGEAERTLAIERIVRSALPKELGKCCSAGRLDRGELQLYADNGAAAAKIRQLSRSLLEKLRMRGLKIDSIRVLVRVNPQARRVQRKKPVMGRKGIDSFRELAAALPASPLRSSIESLVEALKDKKNALDEIE